MTGSKTGQKIDTKIGRVIAVNRFYWPDHSATSQILTDLATHLAGEGRPVTVVTSRMRYDDPSVSVEWPLEPTIISQKDEEAPLLADAEYDFVYEG